MQRRALLLGFLLAPAGGAASGQVIIQPALPPPVVVQPGPPQPWARPGRGRGRGRRCRLVQVQEPAVDRFGRVRGHRLVTREVCR
jgi:hypothetical protein